VPADGVRPGFSNRLAFAIFATVEGMTRSALSWIGLIALQFVLPVHGWSAEVKATPIRAGQFVGSAGCKSSSCHGGAGEKRSQYQTWLQQDFHARSYAILTNARSARIAETLELGAPQTNARCTVCHTPFQSIAPARLMRTAHADEGVSCESCHAAAGSWLRGHTRKDWTYATRVAAGMRDLRSFYVRANTCVACHQNLDADIKNAGHPELIFELDRQSVAEPKHWWDEPSSGPRAWLVGQAVALREVSWRLSQDESVNEDLAAEWNALAWLLAKATSNQSLPAIDASSLTTTPDTFKRMQSQADLLARRAAERGVTSIKILQTLAASDSEFLVSREPLELLFRRAVRLVLALDRLSTSNARETINRSPELDRLFEDVRSRADFQPARFADHLASFRATITQSAP